MAYTCQNSTVLSSTATTAVANSQLVITPTVSLSPENEQRVKILITTSTPTAGASLPVTIVLGDVTMFVTDKYGNMVYGNQIYDNMILKGYYGNNGPTATPHYQLIRIPQRIYYYN